MFDRGRLILRLDFFFLERSVLNFKQISFVLFLQNEKEWKFKNYLSFTFDLSLCFALIFFFGQWKILNRINLFHFPVSCFLQNEQNEFENLYLIFLFSWPFFLNLSKDSKFKIESFSFILLLLLAKRAKGNQKFGQFENCFNLYLIFPCV